jgi:hypothetical protein
LNVEHGPSTTLSHLTSKNKVQASSSNPLSRTEAHLTNFATAGEPPPDRPTSGHRPIIHEVVRPNCLDDPTTHGRAICCRRFVAEECHGRACGTTLLRLREHQLLSLGSHDDEDAAYRTDRTISNYDELSVPACCQRMKGGAVPGIELIRTSKFANLTDVSWKGTKLANRASRRLIIRTYRHRKKLRRPSSPHTLTGKT